MKIHPFMFVFVFSLLFLCVWGFFLGGCSCWVVIGCLVLFGFFGVLFVFFGFVLGGCVFCPFNFYLFFSVYSNFF